MNIPNITNITFINASDIHKPQVTQVCGVEMNYVAFMFINVACIFAMGALYGRTGKKYLGEERARSWGWETLKILLANNLIMVIASYIAWLGL